MPTPLPKTVPCLAVLLLAMALSICPLIARAWGDEGHQIIGLIAEHYLDPAVGSKVAALLAGDSTALTPSTGIADETTWADRFRDSHRETSRWHYIDIELDRPDINAACHRQECIVDEIEQFRRELRSPVTPTDERRRALQFLLHFVGDIHQPLHAADNHDRGGNDLHVRTAHQPEGSLHHYWDTVFVEALGTQSHEVAARLIDGIRRSQRRRWSSGTPAQWAAESFNIARMYVYGRLPSNGHGVLLLDDAYEADARRIVAEQLQRAGVRLAEVLNQALR